MTDREKEKISDLKRYQEKYTSIFVIVNLVLSIFYGFANISNRMMRCYKK